MQCPLLFESCAVWLSVPCYVVSVALSIVPGALNVVLLPARGQEYSIG